MDQETEQMLDWLRAARIVALASFLLFLLGYGLAPDQVNPSLVGLFLGCFLMLLLHPGKPLRIALRLARAIGVMGLLFASIGILVIESMGGRCFVGAFALTQLAMVVSATKTLGQIGQKIQWPRLFATVGILVLIVLINAAISIPMLLAHKKVAHEKSAESALHKINECAAAYATAHAEHGYPASLSAMGPAGGGCLSAQVMRENRDGYRVTYRAIDVDSSGRVSTYAATGRPITYGESGSRSFYTDESGKIRFTPENREPTARDPLVDPPADRH
jgi:type IV pilus assembly protein PilA